jgi:hypothetical protein
MPQATWTEWLQRLALLLSGLFVVLLLVLFALRVAHPYLLEWQEGAMVDQVARILAGEPLYAEPSIEFVAQIYAPLYFYVSAGVAGLTGIGFTPLRVVSIAATLGCLACMGWLVWLETRSRAAVLLSLGLFAATYPIAAAFLDIARVDALFLFFCIAGVAVVRARQGPRAMLAGAALFLLAFLTKQQGALFCVAMVVWVAFARGLRPACLLGGTFAVAAWAATAALSAWTDGWSSFYLFDLPGSHELFWPMLWAFWWMDLLQPLAPACVLAVVWLFVLAREGPTSDLVFWTMLLGVCTGTALGSRMHWGGAANVVLPAYLGIALAWGVALRRLPQTSSVRGRWPTVLAAVAVGQLLWLVYDPRPLVPREADRVAGDAFVEALSELDGDVLATWHGYLPTLAGKAVFAHRSAVYDVMRSDQTEAIAKLQAAFDAALAAHRFGAVVVDQPLFLRDYERTPLERSYRHVGPMLPDGLVVGGLLGYRANPHLYLPRDPSPEPAASGDAGAAEGRRR